MNCARVIRNQQIQSTHMDSEEVKRLARQQLGPLNSELVLQLSDDFLGVCNLASVRAGVNNQISIRTT
jgi:hypothetical protein